VADVNISVGLVEKRKAVPVELRGSFVDESGQRRAAGRHQLTGPITLRPEEPQMASFAIDDVTIGIGFHWERQERQVFRGVLRIIEDNGLTAINDVPVDEYVASVISSEMSASCPLEFLKAHAVISRSWLLHPRSRPEGGGQGNAESRSPGEIIRWYGREAHRLFDVCADDHCQRYQGITKAFTPAAARAVAETAGEALVFEGAICDARFSKCCGGRSEGYRAAWDDRDVPYLGPVHDGPPPSPPFEPEAWIRGDPPAYCNTRDRQLLTQLLPGFDQETRDFYRWTVSLTGDEIRALVLTKIGVDLGAVTEMTPLERGASGRIVRLRLTGERESLIVGKELEIRRALSASHLYSSAFVVTREGRRFVLRGAGWGHGVGLCQIGAAVMASQGRGYREILAHYYRGTALSPLPG
jgi:stage II sporulation protein D